MRTDTSITLLVLSLCAALPAAGAYKDDIGHTALADDLALRGLTLPTGVGVSVTQVESPVTQGGSDYMPNTGDAQFSGKTINDQTGGGTSSVHATIVGKNLYGNSTSMAPSIALIDVYEAGDWLNSGWRTGNPPTESNPLQNHSWVGFAAFQGVTDEPTNILDYAANRDSFLPIVGLYNADYGQQTIPSDIPEIYGSAYNAIAVGVSDGTHRTGVTSVADGPGRTKPEIVAPNSFTSYATPYVTAGAALLIEAAGGNAAAKEPETLKAILLAAADKAPFPSWDQTTLRPIDDVYGAGQLDVYESYWIQQAGQQGTGTSIDPRGWNFTSIGNGGSHVYNLTVPAGFELRNLSALVTWNRSVSQSKQGRFYNYSTSLANLSLTLKNGSGGTLYQSDSLVDNVEHIWRDAGAPLAAGNYTLTVASSSGSVDYALAWRSERYQDYALWSSAAFTAATPVSLRDADDDPDGDGIINRLEQAFGGDPEASDLSILPAMDVVEDGGSRYLEITVRQPSFTNDLSYTVETVTDLGGTWTSSGVELRSIGPGSGDFENHVYRRTTPVTGSGTAFLRVSITP